MVNSTDISAQKPLQLPQLFALHSTTLNSIDFSFGHDSAKLVDALTFAVAASPSINDAQPTDHSTDKKTVKLLDA